MKNIKTSTYEGLTNNQRIIASIEAMARDDSKEIKKLVNTCPKKSYTQTDADYSDKMQRLISTAITVECELRGNALNFYMAMWLDKTKKESFFEHRIKFLQNISNITKAWHNTLEKMGISLETMQQATKELNYEPVIILQDIMPEADIEKVSKYEIMFDELLFNISFH